MIEAADGLQKSEVLHLLLFGMAAQIFVVFCKDYLNLNNMCVDP